MHTRDPIDPSNASDLAHDALAPGAADNAGVAGRRF